MIMVDDLFLWYITVLLPLFIKLKHWLKGFWNSQEIGVLEKHIVFSVASLILPHVGLMKILVL